MLTKEEELKISHFMINTAQFPEDTYTSETIRWFAKKLRELNEECSKLTSELQSSNELNAYMSERYE